MRSMAWRALRRISGSGMPSASRPSCTFSSTTSASPSALRKDLLTPRTSRSGARFRAAAVAFTGVSSDVALSGDAELPLGARVQGAPEHAIQRHDEQAQHDRAEDAALE